MNLGAKGRGQKGGIKTVCLCEEKRLQEREIEEGTIQELPTTGPTLGLCDSTYLCSSVLDHTGELRFFS